MQVLSNKKFEHIITWVPSGKSFVIISPERFVDQVLPVYFKTAKYASFTRKLNRWGFVRLDDAVTGGEEFFHKYFQKSRLDLAEKMTGKVKPTRKVEPARWRDASKDHNTRAVESRWAPPVVAPPPLVQRPLRDLTMHNQQSTVPELHMSSIVGEPLLYERIKALELEAARLRECAQAAAGNRHHALAMMQRRQELYSSAVLDLMGDPLFRYSKMEASQAAYSKMEASQAAYSKIEASQAAYALGLRLHQKRQLDSWRLALRPTGTPASPESYHGLDRELPPLTSNIQVAKTA
jgi:hypothetical protein